MHYGENVIEYLNNNIDLYIKDVLNLVSHDSPSKDKDLVDDCYRVLDELFWERLHTKPIIYKDEDYGDHRLYKYKNKSVITSNKVLVLGHIDTVWEKKEIKLQQGEGYIAGPGILDMKAGIIQSIWALKSLIDLEIRLSNEIHYFIGSDEEIGSPNSREIIKLIADDYDYVLVMEPPVVGSGNLKTGRKGSARFHLDFYGKAAHAGNEHQKGNNAIDEAAHHIMEISSLTNYEKGLTINIGSIDGGGKLNVVPDHTKVGINVRANSLKDLKKVKKVLNELEPINKEIKIRTTGNIDRPPMEEKENIPLFNKAKKIATGIGLNIDRQFVGGGSDGNFTSALGIPTLDGLGAVGIGIHQENERIYLKDMPLRTTLVAKLFEEL